jgi:hypothetical protein
MSRENGGVFGKPVSPDAATATGFWSLNAIQREKIATTWPSDLNITPALKLDFNETTSLDSRISFTRATNGTYFNSSGVLTTAGSGVPRFDHRLENGTWVNKGLLIEEQRTNLVTYSDNLNAAVSNTGYNWAFGSTLSSLFTYTANFTTAPDGTATAVRFVNANGQSGLFARRNQSFAAGTYTISMWIYVPTQVGTTSWGFQSDAQDTSDAATLFSQTVFDRWVRVSLTYAFTATRGFVDFVVIRNDVIPTTGFTVYVWGFQIEAGAFPTSYIATTSASVTRNADVVSMTGTNFSSWYNATEGTIFTQSTIYYNIPSGVFPRIVEFGDGTFNERIIRNYSSSLPGFRYVIVDNSNTVAAIDFTTGQPNGITSNYATAYKVNDFAGSVNGGAVEIATSGTLPTLNKVNLGTDSVSDATSINGHIAKFYYWNTRLSNNFLRDYTKT